MVRPSTEGIPALTARVKVSEDHAETTKRIARLAKQKLKSARRTYKHARKVARRARKAAARLRQTLVALTKKLSRSKARAVTAKKPAKVQPIAARTSKPAVMIAGNKSATRRSASRRAGKGMAG